MADQTPPNLPKRPGTPNPTGSSSGWREKDAMDIDTTPEKVKELSGRAKQDKKKPKRRPSGLPAESDDENSSPEYHGRKGVRPVQYKPVSRVLFQRRPPDVRPGVPLPTSTPAEPEATGAGQKRRGDDPRSFARPKARRRRVGADGRVQEYDVDDPEVPLAPIKPTQWIDDEDMDTEREESDDEPDPPSPTAGRAVRKILKPTGTKNTSRLDRQALMAEAARERQEFEELHNAFREVSINQLHRDWQPETSGRPPPAPPGIPRPNIDWNAPLEEEPMVIDPPPPRAKMLKILRDAKKRLKDQKDKKKGKQQQGEEEGEEEDDELIWSPTEEEDPRAQEKKDNSKPDGTQYHPFRPLVNQGINRHAPQASKDKSTGEHGPPPSARPTRPVEPGQPSKAPTLKRVPGKEDLKAAAKRVPSSGPSLKRRRSFSIHVDPQTGVADLYYNTTSPPRVPDPYYDTNSPPRAAPDPYYDTISPPLRRTGHVTKVKAGSGRVFSSRFRRRNGENFIMAFPYDIRYLIYTAVLQSDARLVKIGRGAPLITAGLDIPPCNNQILFTNRTIYMETFRIFYRINTFEIKVNWEHFFDPLYFLPADFGKAVRKINFVHDFKINPNLKDTLNLMKKVPVFYHYPEGPSTRVLDFETWKDILRNLDYCHIEWKIETWVRHALWAGADLEKQNLTKKDMWDGWDGIWVAIQMYKATQKAGSQRTSSYLCYWESWSDPRYGLNNVETEHSCGVRCKYMADFFKKLWEENVGADFNMEEYEPEVALRRLPGAR
ncbi:hypothetical protein QBC40DRAFT_223682 [Triangularia verruculosa]|uniref:Uncharacterized protein n=1 Tax=Triangularia verruculosa TaxID=2587418 RepID=A0AAN6XIR8_9PEZI|nr:hypothetical protein QBC40DRAFT_223682 [Triangularia verruculosa]